MVIFWATFLPKSNFVNFELIKQIQEWFVVFILEFQKCFDVDVSFKIKLHIYKLSMIIEGTTEKVSQIYIMLLKSFYDKKLLLSKMYF